MDDHNLRYNVVGKCTVNIIAVRCVLFYKYGLQTVYNVNPPGICCAAGLNCTHIVSIDKETLFPTSCKKSIIFYMYTISYSI